MVKNMIKHLEITIPTYEVGSSEELPMFFERRNYQGASGKIYPLPFTASISDEKKESNRKIKEKDYKDIWNNKHDVLK